MGEHSNSDSNNSRYLTPPASLEELGIADVNALVGTADERGSNVWKIEDLVRGLRSGIYSATNGGMNYLDLAENPAELEFLSPEHSQRLQDKIYQRNREVLDCLYDLYEVDFEHARVYAKPDKNGLAEQVTIYPSKIAEFYFRETILTSTPGQRSLQGTPAYIDAQIVAGKPPAQNS